MSKLSKEETVNLSNQAKLKKEIARQALTDMSNGSLGFSLLKSVSMRGRVKGSYLGHFEERGARLVVPTRAVFT